MRTLLLIGTLFSTALATSPGSPAPTPPSREEEMLGLLVGITIILVLAVVLLVIATILALEHFFKEKYGQGFLPKFGAPTLAPLWKKITGLNPKAAEGSDVALNHDYDGIVELDNSAPPLFNYILYGTILYAVIYLLVFHVFESFPLQEEEYKNEIRVAELEAEKRAAQAQDMVTAETVAQLTDEMSLANGKTIFESNCIGCHGDKGQSTAQGPNLTDKYWLHGGGIKNVFTTIANGVKGTAMKSWEGDFSPKDRAHVASYILSLEPAEGPRGAEGELWEPPAADSTATDSTLIE